MKFWFDEYSIPTVLIATKADKLSKSKLNRIWKENIKDFALPNLEQVIYTSAVSKMGRDEIIKRVGKILF